MPHFGTASSASADPKRAGCEGMRNVGAVDCGVAQMCDLPVGECSFGVTRRNYDHDDRYGG